MVKKRIVHYSKERMKDLHGIGKLLFQKPILKFFILIIIYILLINLGEFFKEQY